MPFIALDYEFDNNDIRQLTFAWSDNSKPGLGRFGPVMPALKKMSGTKMVPLGHGLVVRKMVPFGALFWCHFPKGHCFGKQCPFVRWHYSVLVPQGHRNSAFLAKKGTVLVPFFLWVYAWWSQYGRIYLLGGTIFLLNKMQNAKKTPFLLSSLNTLSSVTGCCQ